jgi:cell division septation protein DedD
MAVVVIGVSVFLMGVMVGRGVLAAKGAPGVEATTAANDTEPPPPPASASQGSTSTPSTAGEKLTYAERLGSEPPKEPLKPEASAPPAEAPTPKSEAPAAETAPAAKSGPEPSAKSAAAAANKPAAVAAKPTEAAKPALAAPAKPAVLTPEPAGAGFAIQVAALKEPTDADAIVKRLAGKGYPAYVVTPAKGTPAMFKVRVGKYKDRHEADTVAARLQKEEQFKPWIVR